ncbi:MAG: hypothetical protein LBP20_01220 [Treponema sp.]|nr:hypothetical protein [Treponema sp.]
MSFLCAAALLTAVLDPLGAQDAPEDGNIPAEDDWTGFMPSLYSAGDQIFGLSVGIVAPVAFTRPGGGTIPHNMTIGGAGSLSYDYFLGARVFVGGELEGMFAPTLGDHMLIIVPINLRAGYQFVYKSFEFPLSLGLGIAPQQLRTSKSYSYLGFFMKPRVSAYFRINPDWSVGINAAWWWLPQTTSNPAESVHAHFFEAALAVRYHF